MPPGTLRLWPIKLAFLALVAADAIGTSFLPVHARGLTTLWPGFGPEAAASLPVSLFWLAVAAAQLSVPRWLPERDHYGLMRAALSCVSLALAAAAVAPWVELLVLCRTVAGFAYGVAMILAQDTLLRAYPASARTQASALYLSLFFGGSVAGTVAGGLLAAEIGAVAGRLDAADLCRDSGMDDCLVKPVDTARLGASLSAWLPLAAAETADLIPDDTVPLPPPAVAAPVIDTRSFEALLDGDRAGIRGLLERYRESSAPIYADLAQALADGAATETVRQLAHKLKGASGMVGAGALADLCLAVERAAQADELAEAAAFRPALVAAWAAVETFIASY